MKKFLTDISVIGGEQISENSVLYGSSSYSSVDYSERVRLSGGVVESLPCVANKINDFGNLFAGGSIHASRSLSSDGPIAGPTIRTQSIEMPGLTAKGPVKYNSGALTSVVGYTGAVIVQGEMIGMTRTIVIEDGIIINVV
jgi:hypothetical protein